MPRFLPCASGWLRDTPDYRDYAPDHPRAREMLEGLSPSERIAAVDLREYFPDVFDQRNIGSSSAQACIGLIEYFELRSHGKVNHLSALYLYKSALKLARVIGDVGADLRTVLKAIARLGVPPEYHYPYEPKNFSQEPDPYLHSFADEHRSMVYVRLDRRNTTGAETLEVVKAFLTAGFPVAFGFPIPSSLTTDCDIPYRPTLDAPCGCQAVVAAGFDDQRLRTSKGALLVRSSWGTSWGEDGYGWLPYGYVEQQLAADFWTVLRSDWLASGEFELPSSSQEHSATHKRRSETRPGIVRPR